MLKQIVALVYLMPRFYSWSQLLLLAALCFCCLWQAPEVSAQAAGSNASNYKTGVNVSVDGRTGSVSITAELFSLPGIISGIDASYSLHYDSTRATTDAENGSSAFGLPPGWDLNYSYFGFGVNSGYAEINVDGKQSYPLVDSFTSLFTLEDGSSKLINTQMMQYNRADANVIDYIATGTPPPVASVCGIEVRIGLRNLNGMIQLFSEQGLMLTEIDRFGNHIDFCYFENSPVTGAKIKNLTDTWDNEVAFCYCDGTKNQASICTSVIAASCGSTPSGRIIAVLPDDRQVSYVVEDALVTEVVDAQGKSTRLDWQFDPAGCQSGSSAPWSLTSMTSPLGSVTELVYNCLQVCAEEVAGENGCSDSEDSTLWPVVKTQYTCPNTLSQCAKQPGRLTTQYDYGIAEGKPNYSGFPFYSPFVADPDFPGADRLMQSGDTSFTYQTSVSQLDATGEILHQTLNTYNYVHLLTHSETSINGQLIKSVQHCYTDLENGVCPTFEAPFTQLPANYQSAKISGSCVFNVSGIGTQGSARHSLNLREYNSFGYIVHEQKYHGSSSTGVVTDCTENDAIFNVNNLTLVAEKFHRYDLPQDTDSGARLKLGEPPCCGQGPGHFGLMTATAEFAYADILDLQDSSQYCGADGIPPVPGSPLRVNLSCLTLTDASDLVPTNTLVKTHLAGSLSLTTAASKNVLDQCSSPSSVAWDYSTAPPKATSVDYDIYGRITNRKLSWGIGPMQPGINSTSDTVSYQRVEAPVGSDFCKGTNAALQTTHTDAQGNQSKILACVQNGFLLSSIDADGDTTTYTKDAVGMTTQITHANGTKTTYQHYYACPISLQGDATCPVTSTALQNCPQSSGNDCIVRTLLAGAGNTSYADHVSHIVVKDGLGRTLQTWDNLGGAFFSEMQQRSQYNYDSRGLLISHNSSIGTGTEVPILTYATTIDYGPKLRPQTLCGARGTAKQFVHDDVTQATKSLFNGHQTQLREFNDSQKLTVAIDCEVSNTADNVGLNSCPSTAADLTQASCTGNNNYFTTILRDGTGVAHTNSAATLNTDDLDASTQCIAGTTTFSADLKAYSYTYNSTASTNNMDNTFVAGISNWQRDLHGLKTFHELTLSTGGSVGSTDTFASDSYIYDQLGHQTNEINKLSSNNIKLENISSYNNIGQLSTFTDYAGTTFHNYYDNMKRLVRFCYSSNDQNDCAGLNTIASVGDELSCTTGETYVRDPITGRITELTHFVNPDSTCTETGDGKDIAGDSIRFMYTPFGKISSKIYLQNVDGSNTENEPITVALRWGYDPYQRPVCFRDAMASTELGQMSDVCGDENTAVSLDFSPSIDMPEDHYLSWNLYYPDSDPYRRGLLQSSCRIVSSTQTTSGFDTRCTDIDYYTPESTDGGSCTDVPSPLNAPGAYAGKLKSRTNCKGGSCATGNGSILSLTSYDYDSHRRPCRVVSSDGDGTIILGSTYQYDQYNNLLSETTISGIDTSTSSNYQLSYTYDGIQRLLNSTRNDLQGNLLQSIDYEFDAASNVKMKVEKNYVPSTGEKGKYGRIGQFIRLLKRKIKEKYTGNYKNRYNGKHESATGKQCDPCVVTGSKHVDTNERMFDSFWLPRHPGNAENPRSNKKFPFSCWFLPTRSAREACQFEGTSESITTTNYTYNADGALTSVVVTPEGTSNPETTTLIWDNYDSSTNPPTLSAANGNLQRIEAADGSIKSYAFDTRDRLIGMQVSSQAVAYTYDPASMMTTSTIDGGASFRFYYDMNRHAQAVNVIQAQSTWGTAELASARIGRDRYLSDGSNQLALRHRKDSDALYNPDTSSITKYNYDPYGAPFEGAQNSGTVNYDLHQNQFRYNNEYTDALTGAQYLRARWYDPTLQIFMSRDSVSSLSRYGYVGGNPTNRIDPSGNSFLHSLEHSFSQNFTSAFGLKPMFNKSYWTEDRENVQWWLNTVLVIGQAALLTTEVGSGAVLGYESIFTPLARGGQALGIASVGMTIDSSVRAGMHGEGIAQIAGNILGGYSAGLVLAGGTASISLGSGFFYGLASYDSPFELRGSELAQLAAKKYMAGSTDVDVYFERAVAQDEDRDVGRHDITGAGWGDRAHAQIVFVGSDFVRRIDYGTDGVGGWNDGNTLINGSTSLSQATDESDTTRRFKGFLRRAAGSNDIITDDPAFMKLGTLTHSEYTQGINNIQTRVVEIHNGPFELYNNNCFDAASRASRILFGYD